VVRGLAPTSPPVRPGGLRGLVATAALLADLVRVQEVLFSMPLAFAGAILGARGWPPAYTVPWIALAVAGGKVGGMALNRLVDRDLDARHPETAGRHLPAGLVTPRQALAVGVFGLALLAVSAFALGPLPVAFLPAVVGLVVVYSYTKRWGWGCHFALAAVGFFLPFAGWIAVTGRLSWAAVLFGAAAACWYVGFDSMYALRDVAWDRILGVHSLPADLGVPATLRIARLAHVLFLAGLGALGRWRHLPWPWWAATAAVAATLAWQHVLTARSLRPVAFARFNTAVACLLLAGSALGAAVGLGG
jgi:4-hydroxybenzoate polyprenyltransferase